MIARRVILGSDGDGIRLKGRKILIACGTRPAHSPDIPFDNHRIVDTDHLGELGGLPKEIIVVGAGVVGLEYASFMTALGAEVTLIDQRPVFLDFVDRQIVEALSYHLRQHGVTFRLAEKVTQVGIDAARGRVFAHLESGKRVQGDALVYAVGRQANGDQLHLEAAGLAADSRGKVKVNEFFQTDVPHIYAAGDVIGFPALASEANCLVVILEGPCAGCEGVNMTIRSSILLAMIAVPPAGSQVNVLTHHNDNRRTGANLQETQLTVANVKQKFGKLWTLFVDGQIVAQPLYVSGLNVDTKGTFNAVIVATMHNTIYAYDADKKPTMPQSQDALIWAQWLGQPQPENFGFDSWNTNFPEYGILSTPVINDARTIMYVVSWHNNNGGQFRLHAIDMTKAPFPGPGNPPTDYREKINPAPVITASVPKPGGGQIKLDTTQQKQRAALLLDNGVLYLGFSTNRETGGTLHGWLLAYDAATLKQKAVWNVTPTQINGGIWQAGSGPAADASGNVYVMTGNGNFNADTGGKNFSDSFVKLKLEGTTLAVKDYFTPCNQKLLDKACGGAGRCDLDLGSAGPLVAPGTTAGSDLLIGGGKDGNIYVVDTANMGHFKAPAGQVTMDCPNPNAVQAIMGPQSQQGGQGVVGNIHGSLVMWRGPDVARVFVWGEEDVLRSYEFKNGKLVTPPTKSLYHAPPGMPGGMLSISADGNKAGTGIVWALLPFAGDANQQRGVQAQLLAFDAQNIANDIFRSSPPDDPAGPDSVGLFAKFAPPIVANGKVFVPTYGDHENPPGPTRYFEGNRPPNGSVPKNFYLAVYGLKP